MHTLEDRMKTVSLYLKYGRRSTAVRQELGYPSDSALRSWVEEFEATGTVHDKYRARAPKYSSQQKQVAVDCYLEHGRNMSRTIEVLGYPGRATLKQWLDEAIPDRQGLRTRRSPRAKSEFTGEQKQAAVLDLCFGSGTVQEIAEKHGTSRSSLYKWRYELLGKERSMTKSKREESRLENDKRELLTEMELLKAQVEELNKQVHRLQLERDILEVTAELLKKEKGADPKRLSNREKAVAIGALRDRYPLNELLQSIRIAKSSYYYQRAVLVASDKYSEIRERVRSIFAESNGCYGYRRIHAVLARGGSTVSEKVVRRLMRDQNLIAVGRKKRRYNSYRGEISAAVPNLIERNFHAEAPNVKWVTDLTEFQVPAGRVYLSLMVDCFDGMAVSWSFGTSADAGIVNSMLDNAISTLAEDKRPVVHSDRGSHYRWPGWIARMEATGLTRSMSRKGCSPDNAACEGFFGRLKNEFFYGRSWAGVSIDEFIGNLDRYLHWYNEKRLKICLDAMSPIEYRQSLGYAT